MKCKDCKYFESYNNKLCIEYGRCNHDKLFFDYECRSERFIDGIGESWMPGESSSIYIGKEFGCIHFEKEKNEL